MRHKFIIIGITTILIFVSLSGCVTDESTAKEKGEKYIKNKLDILWNYFAILYDDTSVYQYGKDAWEVRVSGELYQDWKYVKSFTESCYVKKENGDWTISETEISAEPLERDEGGDSSNSIHDMITTFGIYGIIGCLIVMVSVIVFIIIYGGIIKIREKVNKEIKNEGYKEKDNKENSS